jgi:hypothetical protein
MYFWPTVFSYLTLLRLSLGRPRRGPRTALAVALLVPLLPVVAACSRGGSPGRDSSIPASRPAPSVQALPEEGFRVEWISNTVPKEVKAGSTFPVSVTFKNAGTAVWLDPGSTGSQSPDAGAVRMGHRWRPPGGRAPAYAGARIDLAGPLRPGQSITLSLSLSAPSVPGTYRLQFDLVQEHVAWFEGMDAPRLIVPVRVL